MAPMSAHSQPNDLSFDAWLERYGAWDMLEKEVAADSADTPASVLKRAQVYLNLNSPQKALELIEMTTAFDDNATESERLFLGGQAHRALGDLPKAVLWFTQSAQFNQDTGKMRAKFRAEPRLGTIWADVWTRSYWTYRSNFTLSKQPQREALEKILTIGRTVWNDDFWENAGAILASENATEMSPSAPQGPQSQGNGAIAPIVSTADTQIIVKAMALVSLEKFSEAKAEVDSISNEAVRTFWSMVVSFLETGDQPQDLTTFATGNFMKAHAFWSGNVLAPYSASRAQWVLGNPESAPWKKFRNNLLSMPLEEAQKAIDNELGSMLISQQTAALLQSFKLALSLSDGDFINSATTWNKLDKRQLPLALQVAALLEFKGSLEDILPTNPAESFKVYPILCALSAAAGQELNLTNEAPFWTQITSDNLQRLSQRDWPLDKLLLLAYWQQQFKDKPTENLAKRGAFLFDDTSFGTRCLLYLADQAVHAKKLQLGAYYLNKIEADSLPAIEKMSWLDTKIRLELDAARQPAALETFKQMNALGLPIPTMTRLRMALLYQQNRDFDAAQTQLLAMWDNRASMTTALQAETLFWLGEGEHATRHTEKALQYYLRLAWQYPQENIWALTAMYRASLIYEKRGKYETAKRLLTTVVKRADTKEQREAAKARIDAIDRKMGKNTDKESTLVFPF